MSDVVLSDQNGEALSVSSSSGSVTILGPRYDLVTNAVNFGEIPINLTKNRQLLSIFFNIDSCASYNL